ncbi:MAG: hypothetical protein ACRDZR_17410 [Acidimicrobiales bacterium]
MTTGGGDVPEESADAEIEVDGPEGEPGWFGVRCIFRWSGAPTYEERITLWQADSLDHAIARAEDDAAAYAERLGSEYLEIAQAYWIGPERPEQGSEVFSLMRDSDLEPDDYLDAFYDTGRERQRTGA